MISLCSALPTTVGQGASNWFRTKPDGTIAFAENPPKKYRDIYPIDFNADMEGIEKEVERIMDLWVKAGVTVLEAFPQLR